MILGAGVGLGVGVMFRTCTVHPSPTGSIASCSDSPESRGSSGAGVPRTTQACGSTDPSFGMPPVCQRLAGLVAGSGSSCRRRGRVWGVGYGGLGLGLGRGLQAGRGGLFPAWGSPQGW